MARADCTARAASSSWASGGKPKNADQDDALIVHEELIDAAFITEQISLHRLDGCMQAFASVEASRIGAFEVNEQHADIAKLGEPCSLAGLNAIHDDGWYTI